MQGVRKKFRYGRVVSLLLCCVSILSCCTIKQETLSDADSHGAASSGSVVSVTVFDESSAAASFVSEPEVSVSKETVLFHPDMIPAYACEPYAEMNYVSDTGGSVSDMAEHNKKYYYGDRHEVIADGFQPCKRCNP